MQLPDHPVLPSGPLRAALEAAQAVLCRDGYASLPQVRGLAGAVLARWWVRHAGRWPLVVLSPGALLQRGALDIAQGGWLHVLGSLPHEHAGLVLDLCAARGVWLTDEAGPVVEGDEAWTAGLLALDALHVVASDPALDTVRAGLLAHARAAGIVHLKGEPGTGRSELARWAHAALQAGTLDVLQGGEGRAGLGRWLLARDLQELTGGAVRELQRALMARRRRGRAAPVPFLPAPARPEHGGLAGLVGQSAALRRVLARVVELAPTPLPVLIVGEPGVGKEVVAHAVHRTSGRAGPFEAIDMGALSPELAESTLFGHAKGAFTGATEDRIGLFRRARGGTVFLDEIGNLVPSLQAKLLRVLETRTVKPLGSDATFPIDVRIVAATNADLDAMVDRGTFRADLLSRLAGFTLEVPPLRERAGDIRLLAEHFADQPFSDEAIARLESHDWPGNARELRHVVQFACAVAKGPVHTQHLGPLAEVQGAAALLTTGTGEAIDGLDPGEVRELTMVTLSVPPLRERGPASIRHHVLHALEGVAMESAALDLLSRAPWWGNEPELHAAMRALLAAADPMVRVSHVRALLPEAPSTRAPLRVLLAPSLDGSGQVQGLLRDYDDSSLLVGRVASMSHLRRASVGDARLSGWVAALESWTGGTDPACLDLSLMPALSRAQVWVGRGGEGLWVRPLPSTALHVEVNRLDGAPCASEFDGGTAAEIRLRRPGRTECELQIFVFLGAVAYDAHGMEAVHRWRAAQRQDSDQTEVLDLPSPVVEAPGRGGLRVWVLSQPEIDAINQVVCSVGISPFKAHLMRASRTWRPQPELQRLRTFVLAAPRVAQYIARLYALDGNHELRADLVRRYAGDPGVLPKGIRQFLPSE